MSLLIPTNQFFPEYQDKWLPRYIFGVLLIILGVWAVYASVVATLITVVFVGCLLAVAGIVIEIDTFSFWRKRNGFLMHLLVGLLYLIAGLVLIVHPGFASITLTWILSIVYIIAGISRMILSFRIRLPRWGWGFFNGLLTFLLGVLILSQWPASGLFVIGLFVGIDLIFAGWAYLSAASALRIWKN